MSYATIDWCKQAILLIATVYFYVDHVFPSFAASRKLNQLEFQHHYSEYNYQPDNILLGQKVSECKQINALYDEVYSFETEDDYINVCQVGDDFYYHRQSKFDPENELLIRAEAVFGGSVFQASEGKTIYFVGKDGDRYYSSVMQNSNEIVFEPELLDRPPIFSRSVPATEVDFSVSNVILTQLEGISYNSWSNSSLEKEIAQDSLVCTQSQSALNSHLNGWVNLLGKSPDVASSMAVDNGHNFVYDRDVPDRALIETKEGTIINLNIATTSETIERVCIEPVADNF